MESSRERRPLGLLDVTCLGVNAIVGSSIFLFPGKLAGLLGPASILSFAILGLLLIPVGLCFAEAASRFDRPGGVYLYAREAFGEWPGFAIGWMSWVTQVLSWAAVANGIAVYLGFFGAAYASASAVKLCAALVIVSLGTLNYRGVKQGAWASDLFTAAKLIPLGLFVLLGLGKIRAGNFFPFAPHGLGPLGPACFLTYFAFQGFENVPVPSGEVDRPQRNIPLAVVGSLVFATLLYVLVQIVAIGVCPVLAASPRPLAEAARVALGPWGAGFMVLGAVLSMTGFNSGTALVTPRYLAALSEQKDIPDWFGRLHPKHGTPAGAIATTTACALVLAMALDFSKLVDFSNIVVCVQYIAACAAVPVLRRKKPQASALRLPGGWFFPAFGIAVTLWLGAQAKPGELGWSAAALAAGVGLRLAWTRRRGPIR